jgi:type I restriction enzyme M protein
MESSQKLDLHTTEIRTINELLDLFEPQRGLLGNFLLFRGQKKDYGPLNPSIFRYDPHRHEASNIEQEIYSDFYNLIRNYPVARDMRNPWELLCYAQHIGVPTRLLDWTINPLIAAYFAVEDAYVEGKPNGIIYVLDVTSFDSGKHIRQRSGFRGHTLHGLPQSLPFLEYFGSTQPQSRIHVSSNPMQIIQPPILDARMQAQSSLFSVSLHDTVSHDTHFGEHLGRITIQAQDKQTIHTQLYRMGVHAASVYPDAEGIGRYLTNRRDREFHILW